MATHVSKDKLWGGRFKKPLDKEAFAFSSSLEFDCALAEYDLLGSRAYAQALGAIGIVDKKECALLIAGIDTLLKRLHAGKLSWGPEFEDVHSALQIFLEKEIGPAAYKLHTGRSRNEQVANAVRMYCKKEIAALSAEVKGLMQALVKVAKHNVELIMPAYTHLQHSQPVFAAYYLLAYCQMLERDRARLADAYVRTDVCVLGSGACCGNGFAIDREKIAKTLGFAKFSDHSLDAVSDRDFALEFLACMSVIAMHLSRLSEELILWSTKEFGFIRIPDELCTGSSMMPQKKNPDMLELIRANTAKLYAATFGALTMMKGLPLSYNRDMQTDKEFLFPAVAQMRSSVRIMAKVVRGVSFDKEKIDAQLEDHSLFATDIAEYLVKKGVAFRQAHGIVGALVAYGERKAIALGALSLKELKGFSPKFERDFFALLTPKHSVNSKKTRGSTSYCEVSHALARWSAYLKKDNGS
jgi:argininosuccinate lyase